MSTRYYSAPEPLEDRIAPAALITFMDNGHLVTVKSSLGTNTDLMAAVGTPTMAGSVVSFATIDLADHPIFKGSDFSIVADSGLFVNVGDFNATGLNLGTVNIGGDVDQIEAGDSAHPGTAFKSLHIASLDKVATATIANPGTSTIFGGITTLSVDGDFDGAFFLNSTKGSIKTASIGGNMVGGAMQGFGTLSVGGTLGSITVLGGLMGSTGADSGSIEAVGSITKAIVGSITGGVGLLSGQLMSQANITAVTVTGAITGNADVSANAHNGQIFAAGKITTATIGSLVGGSADSSGSVTSGAGFGKVTVGATGNTSSAVITGGAGTESGTIGTAGSIANITVNGSLQGGSGTNSGDIQASGSIGAVTVHGSVTGGSGTQSGAIGSNGALGKVAIDGALTGGSGNSSGQVVSVTSIAGVTIGTSSAMANVVGGGGTESGSIGSLGKVGPVNVTGSLMGGDGFHSGVVISATSIGAVSIGGSVTASSDADVGGSDASILAPTIASVSITGSLTGGSGQQSGQISGTHIGDVQVGGSIMGGSGDQSGEIRALVGIIGKATVGGAIGNVTVGGSLVSGTANGTGSIISFGSIKAITVDGSLDGTHSLATTSNSGSIFTFNLEDPFNHDIGAVLVKGNLLGGAGQDTGSIESDGSIASVTIGTTASRIPSHAGAGAGFHTNAAGGTGLTGYVRGGGGAFSGSIEATDGIPKVLIYNDLNGGSGNNAGQIHAQSLPAVTIEGGIFGGSAAFTGTIEGGTLGAINVGGGIEGGSGDHAASVLGFGSLKSLTVEGGIELADSSGDTAIYIYGGNHLGSVTAGFIIGDDATTQVYIISQGILTAKTQAQAVAIDKVSVGSNMSFTSVLAGFDDNANAVNGHASIGTIALNTTDADAFGWQSDTVNAGAVPSMTEFYTHATGGNAKLLSEIANITIGGAGINPSTTTTGLIVADEVIAVSALGNGPVNLHKGPANDELQLGGGAIQLFEIGTPNT